MSKAEEILRKLAEDIPYHPHVVADDDSRFIIDSNTRVISHVSSARPVLMQYDHNSEKYTFEVSRYVEGHDMTLCNRVRVHFNNISSETGEEFADVAELYDLALSPEDDSILVCTWTITRQATQFAGTLAFLVQFECIDDNGESVYEWHSDIYRGVQVKKSHNNAEQAVIEYSNVLEQWYQRIFGAGDSVMADVVAAGDEQCITIADKGDGYIMSITEEGQKQLEAVVTEGSTLVETLSTVGASQLAAIDTASNAQLEAIVSKGEETLATIPEDYTTTYNMAEEALRRKANVIELDAEGENIVVNDSSDAYLLGLNVYGRTTQVKTSGKNLCSLNNITFTKMENAPLDVVIPAGTYYVSLLAKSSDTEDNSCVINFYSNDAYVNGIRFDRNTRIKQRVALTQDVTNLYCYASTSYLDGENDTATFSDIMITVDENAEYEPYTGGIPAPNPEYPQELVSVENPVVTIRGKNLIPFPYTDTTVTKNGITFTVNDDGSIRVSGTATKVSVFTVFQGSLPLNGVFTLSGVTNNVSPSTHYMQPYVDGVFKDAQINGGRTYEINGNLSQISLYVKNGETVNCTIYPQLEFGDHATDYEPSKPVQHLTVNRALHGIPVTSGGNYTDANGQQWICDEIDFERGVYVQRTKKFVLSELNPDTWYTWGVSKNTDGVTGFYHYFTEPVLLDFVLCNIGLYGAQTWGGVKPGVGASANSKYLTLSLRNEILADTSSDEKAIESLRTLLTDTNVTMLAAIEPIVTPLTEEEIAYYKKLKTYYHNTTVINDHNARMAIKYAADTEIFLRDNQPKPTDEQILDAVTEYASQNGVQYPTDEHIAAVIAKYLRENPIDTGSKLTIGTANLLADKWVGSVSPYSQVVTIHGVTPYSQVDLTPSVEQLAVFHEKDLTFVTENEDGIVTVYAIGQKPTNDYTIQVTIKEVSV